MEKEMNHKEEMNQEPEIGRKVAIDLGKANLFAVAIMAVSAVVLLVPFFLIWHDRKSIVDLMGGRLEWFLAAFVAGIVVYELMHGLTWAC